MTKPKMEKVETKKLVELTTETKVALDKEPLGGGESPLKFKFGLKKEATNAMIKHKPKFLNNHYQILPVFLYEYDLNNVLRPVLMSPVSQYFILK